MAVVIDARRANAIEGSSWLYFLYAAGHDVESASCGALIERGLIAASYVTRVIQALLFGVAPHDLLTFVGVTLTMTAIGLVACWIPALRAARIDPAISMRSE